jgi:predicted RNA-binding Zn-ribbon protein involved in translation (DUF1610 family)
MQHSQVTWHALDKKDVSNHLPLFFNSSFLIIFTSTYLFYLYTVCTTVPFAHIAQRRLQRAESRLKSKTELQPIVLGHETKAAIKNKIEGIENLTEEDFDTLIIMMKSLRRTLLEESKILFKCPRCGITYHSKPNFCSNCGLDLSGR